MGRGRVGAPPASRIVGPESDSVAPGAWLGEFAHQADPDSHRKVVSRRPKL